MIEVHNMNICKFTLSFIIFALLASAPDIAAETADVLSACQTNIAMEIQAFRADGNHKHLIQANSLAIRLPYYSRSHVPVIHADDILIIKINTIKACYLARDKAYNIGADHGIMFTIMPPLGAGPVALAGMDPLAIKDPVVRKQYEDAIADNDRRNAKDIRERDLQQAIDSGLNHLKMLYRNVRTDARAQEAFIGILTNSITDVGLRRLLLNQIAPFSNASPSNVSINKEKNE